MSPSVMSFPLLYPKTLGRGCAKFKSPLLLSHFLLISHKIWHWTTRSHTSCCLQCHYCHYCNVDFVLFHDVTCYTNSMLLSIHVDTANLFNNTCTLFVVDMKLWRLERTFEHSRISYLYMSHNELHMEKTYTLKSSDTTIQVQIVVHVLKVLHTCT